MTHILSHNQSKPARPMVAVVLFLVVYVAAFVVTLAPKEMLGVQQGSMVQPAN